MDEDLVRYLGWLLWHRRICGESICRTCDSARGLRSQVIAQVFSTVVYDEQKISFKRHARKL